MLEKIKVDKKMSTLNEDEIKPTMCNKYPNEEREYIFAVKGRPFGCLASPHFPPPTTTLLDYNLVKDLGLKMYNLKYEKFTYGGIGMKMRIVGKVHITAQTISDGVADGAYNIEADVVLDLNKNLDCEGVAGVKIISQLERQSCTPSGASYNSSTTPTSTPSSLSPPRHSPAEERIDICSSEDTLALDKEKEQEHATGTVGETQNGPNAATEENTCNSAEEIFNANANKELQSLEKIPRVNNVVKHKSAYNCKLCSKKGSVTNRLHNFRAAISLKLFLNFFAICPIFAT